MTSTTQIERTKPLLLNCDLGENSTAGAQSSDALVMPFIDQASIACGFHAGSPLLMQTTVQLAKQYGVSVGAHPSYPDLAGFGRRSMALSRDELIALVIYQTAALNGLCASQGISLDYVKPHGALYNDMMAKADVRLAIMDALSSFPRPLTLMLQATPESEQHRQEGKTRNLNLQFEAFADRGYSDNGRLLPRGQAGAILRHEKMLAQVSQLQRDGTVTTHSGLTIALNADTLCVHGDNTDGVRAITLIRQLIHP